MSLITTYGSSFSFLTNRVYLCEYVLGIYIGGAILILNDDFVLWVLIEIVACAIASFFGSVKRTVSLVPFRHRIQEAVSLESDA